MREKLPPIAAAASIPDPQNREEVILTSCAFCEEPLYEDDLVIADSDGYFFCDEQCYINFLCRSGFAKKVELVKEIFGYA